MFVYASVSNVLHLGRFHLSLKLQSVECNDGFVFLLAILNYETFRANIVACLTFLNTNWCARVEKLVLQFQKLLLSFVVVCLSILALKLTSPSEHNPCGPDSTPIPAYP